MTLCAFVSNSSYKEKLFEPSGFGELFFFGAEFLNVHKNLTFLLQKVCYTASNAYGIYRC